MIFIDPPYGDRERLPGLVRRCIEEGIVTDRGVIVTARAEYLRLADTLWRSVGGEGSSPAPLPDREIFELLGFD